MFKNLFHNITKPVIAIPNWVVITYAVTSIVIAGLMFYAEFILGIELALPLFK